MIEIRVVPRNLRWEVSVDGITRRLVDWLCTKDRAVEHAFERATELLRWDPHARAVVILERPDHTEEDRTLLEPSSIVA